MRFKVTLTDEESVVLGQYDVEVVEKLDEEHLNESLDNTSIEESDFDSLHNMGVHARFLGELILDDVEAIYLQRKREKGERNR